MGRDQIKKRAVTLRVWEESQGVRRNQKHQEKGESEWEEATEKQGAGKGQPKTNAYKEIWIGRFWMREGPAATLRPLWQSD